MSNYKIVASDLDGTLLNDKAEISRENLNAIDELIKKGVYFVPCTGRTISEIPAELTNNPNIRYIIHSNGASVYDKETDKRILNCIPNSLGREILDIVNEYECHITFRRNGKCYVDSAFQSEEDFAYYNVCEAHCDVVRKFATHLDDFKTESYMADEVEVFSVFFHNYEDKLKCKKKFEEIQGLCVVAVSEYNLEIVNVNAGKGNALCTLAELTGVDIRDTISIGDSDNDSNITKVAGLGLAVSNAESSLKEIADEIICSNEEHVAIYVLKHYFS